MAEIIYQSRPATNEEREYTAQRLREHTEHEVGRKVTFEPFGLMAYDGDRMIGSVIGKIYLGWLHIDLIWVDDSYRKKGTGKNLMRLSQELAQKAGLEGIEVWTQSWQAPDFYRKLGYEEFAVFDDFIPGRKRHAFRKKLA